jgi:hypothetical protein
LLTAVRVVFLLPQYVSASAPGSRWDIAVEYEIAEKQQGNGSDEGSESGSGSEDEDGEGDGDN